jgi:hypothetical protein
MCSTFSTDDTRVAAGRDSAFLPPGVSTRRETLTSFQQFLGE